MASCESCGMPLSVEVTSKLDARYCIYCQDQESGSLATFDQVREGSISAAVRLMGKSKEEAVEMADDLLPTLPRWAKTE